MQRSYSDAVKEKKKENTIIIKPKIQQESEATKKLVKEKIDIKNMAMKITEKRKQGNSHSGLWDRRGDGKMKDYGANQAGWELQCYWDTANETEDKNCQH